MSEGKSRQIKDFEDINKKYNVYSVMVVDKQLKRHFNQNHWPEKLVKIVHAVFNNPMILDHAAYVKENGAHVFYSEPYQPMDSTKIDFDRAISFGVRLVRLISSHDDLPYHYKIIISNPGNLRKPDMSIGFKGFF